MLDPVHDLVGSPASIQFGQSIEAAREDLISRGVDVRVSRASGVNGGSARDEAVDNMRAQIVEALATL